MSRVKKIGSELKKLSPAELRHIYEWLDEFLEDQMEFNPEFESAIQESEKELKAGLQSVRHRKAAEDSRTPKR